MRLPIIQGVIDRRILVNFRVEPDALARLLPPPFQPKLVHGFGIAGICLIRLKHLRPAWLPRWMGLGSENAAHRIAVQWEAADGRTQEGVYVPRRDTSSWLNALAGGRLFPGVHHHARFDVAEDLTHYHVTMKSDDGTATLALESQLRPDLSPGSVFRTLQEASDFFERGSVGYSPASLKGRFDGLELRTNGWQVAPLEVSKVESSFFENRELFPPGAAAFDCALLMRQVVHQWLSRESLCATPISPALETPIASCSCERARV